MVWHGIASRGYGMGTAWVWYGMAWCGMVWYSVPLHGIVWFGMVWCAMVWYGMVWHAMGIGSGWLQVLTAAVTFIIFSSSKPKYFSNPSANDAIENPLLLIKLPRFESSTDMSASCNMSTVAMMTRDAFPAAQASMVMGTSTLSTSKLCLGHYREESPRVATPKEVRDH